MNLQQPHENIILLERKSYCCLSKNPYQIMSFRVCECVRSCVCVLCSITSMAVQLVLVYYIHPYTNTNTHTHTQTHTHKHVYILYLRVMLIVYALNACSCELVIHTSREEKSLLSRVDVFLHICLIDSLLPFCCMKNARCCYSSIYTYALHKFPSSI